jgi:hypothetical protein
LLKRRRSTADDGSVGPEQEQAQRAVEELVAHYQAKARAVARTAVAIGAFVGVAVGAIPLSPFRAAWPIPSGFGFATLLGGLVAGVLIGYVIGDPRAKLYQRRAEQARLQLQLEQRISHNDARMAQLLTALTARATAAAQRQPAAVQPVQPLPVQVVQPVQPVPQLRTQQSAAAQAPLQPVAPGLPPLSPPTPYRADTR